MRYNLKHEQARVPAGLPFLHHLPNKRQQVTGAQVGRLRTVVILYYELNCLTTTPALNGASDFLPYSHVSCFVQGAGGLTAISAKYSLWCAKIQYRDRHIDLTHLAAILVSGGGETFESLWGSP